MTKRQRGRDWTRKTPLRGSLLRARSHTIRPILGKPRQRLQRRDLRQRQGTGVHPNDDEEALLNPPAYEQRYIKKPAQGWLDDQFLVVKQHLLSANEQDGDYIVSALFGVTAPSGSAPLTNKA